MEDDEGSPYGRSDGAGGVADAAAADDTVVSPALARNAPLATDPDTPPSWFHRRADEAPAPLEICRFLASEADDGRFGPAVPAVAASNRCLALGDPAPQSSRQQELVCLAAAHHNCPRYIRGVLLESMPPARRKREPISAAVVASSLVLIGAIAATFGFLAVRGGFGVELLSPSPRPVAALSSPVASPSVAPASSSQPTSSPSPTPTPAPSASPEPTSDRFAVLTRCPSTPDCWVYVIRSGDNLFSIAHWFGVPLERIYEMNPWARTTGLKAGQHLRIPTPTR